MINQENALVSIIVPIYGTEKYLKKCVDSIIKQTYRKLEIILVNDGSPDNSYTIMQEYQRNDVRVKIVNNSENLGLFRARLEGARVSNGDYLMFVDSDDYMGIDFVRLLVNAAESEQADIVKAQFVMEDSSRDYKYIDKGFSRFLDNLGDNLEKKEYLLPNIVAELLEKNLASVKVLNTSDRWIGITYKEDIEPAQEKFRQMIDSGVYPKNLWQ